ncbi:4,5-DOPA dioxygenase extradiol [Riemerella columbina]|uniref:4,5-DOPA-extradiol-dioxygenase n=1 Tax=Riemerella columbina TaxID=103810 RepID=UPI00266EEF35|nr:4,5-DOPA dioxygenase extradiol [Riemerella columbina]WKS94627.1 4,5-DOPA dioxygenase extradiol [Riemerella columbina]
MSGLKILADFTARLKKRDGSMPALFIGHGSPMNGIEDNAFSNNWKAIGKTIDTPSAILVISAHWLSKGTHITAMEHPKTIHDFSGFPPALSAVQYPAAGKPELAKEIQQIVQFTQIGEDHDWGLDHGAWTILRHMFPDAEIPVLQLSIDYYQPATYHFELAKELQFLRNKGVLIVGSGNIIHNLKMVAWNRLNEAYGYDWAHEAHALFNKSILSADHQTLLHPESMGTAVQLSVPTPDHYYPLIYTLGLQKSSDSIALFNDELLAGSLSMTSLVVG